MSPSTELDVAVIGLSCEFAGAVGLDGFWAMLQDGRSYIRRLSDHEMEERGASHQLGATNVVRSIAPLRDIATFDNRKFGISSHDANMVDPQLRMLLKHGSQALRNSGYDPSLFWGQIGVFGAASISTEWAWEIRDGLGPGRSMAIGEVPYVERDFYMTRLAYHLGLRGPAVLVNSACSSSHVAVHTAIQSLLAGDCEIALVGAASVRPFWGGYQLHEGGFFSPTGTCVPFSERADGTVPGEAAAFVVLKRLDAAREDGDQIFCIIKSSALNNDGNQKPGYAGPSERGQADVIEAALDASGIPHDALAFIETHGTGTRLGDPIEVAALSRALRRWGRTDPVNIGSVKANVGHTDVAAGLAGLIKAALILRHRSIPAELPVEVENPLCRLLEHGLTLAQTAADLSTAQGACAGISCFGIGGTNGHIVIQAGDDDFPMHWPDESGGNRFDGVLRQHNARRTDIDVRQSWPAMKAVTNREAAADEVLAILQEHLPGATIALDSDLHALGIDSIGTVMITEDLDTRFGRSLSAAQFIEFKTVADLVSAVLALSGDPSAVAETPTASRDQVEPEPDGSPLTLGQNRFFHPVVAHPATEMCASILRVEGTVDIHRLKSAVANTIVRHQALRSRYTRDDRGRWSVRYEDYPADGYFKGLVLDKTSFEMDRYCQTIFSSVSFERSPLFFAHLISFKDDGSHILILFSHKVMLDGNSFRMLSLDLAALYETGHPQLPRSAPISIYSEVQNEWYKSIGHEQERAYWTQSGWADCRSMPVDQEDGVAGLNAHDVEAKRHLSTERTADLLARLRGAKISLFDLILYAVVELVTSETGGEWAQLSCTFGGRSDLLGPTGRDFSSTVGLLALNGLLLLSRPEGEGVVEKVGIIKRQLAAIPAKGLSYFVESEAPLKNATAGVNSADLPTYNREISVNFHGYDGYDAPAVQSAQIQPARTYVNVPDALDRWVRLDLNLGFEDGKLFISCRHSSRQYRASTINGFLDQIQDSLLSLPESEAPPRAASRTELVE